VKHHLAIWQTANWFTIFDNVTDKHYRPVAFLHGIVTQGVGPQIIADRTEGFSEVDLINIGELLTSNNNYAMVEPGSINLGSDFRANWFGKVNANDFRTTGIR
jgi:hypothetical protein